MALNHRQQNAFDTFMAIMQSYGLSGFHEIAKVVKKAILDGTTDPQQLDLLVRDTDAWHQRFAGNDMLVKNGGNALSVSEYLATETAMAQVMKQAGLPVGFYDQPSDFSKFIGSQVSASELQGRVQEATDLMNRQDGALVDQLTSMGLSKGDLLAYYLDPSKAAPILQQQYGTALIGAAARRAGVATDNAYAQSLYDQGVSEQQAIQGFSSVAEITPGTKMLGDIYGIDYGQSDAEKEVFGGGTSQKREQLASAERASFSGSSGATKGSLSRNRTGSY